MGMSGIADDIVKGVKKFGKEVIEGAKDGPGKAARIKKGATVMKSNGARVDLNSRLKNNAEDVKKIINRGRQDFDSLSKKHKEVFKTFEKHADSSGEVKNYADLVAEEMDRVRKMSDEDIVKSGVSRLKSYANYNIGPRPSGVSDADWAKHTRNEISRVIDPATNTPGRVVGDFAGGGIYGSYNTYKNMADGKKSIVGAIKEGHSKVNDAGEKVLDMKRVAGTATTAVGAASLGNRVFRDEYGSLDIPVVPFI